MSNPCLLDLAFSSEICRRFASLSLRRPRNKMAMTQWRPWTPSRQRRRRRRRRLYGAPEMKDLRAKSALGPPALSAREHEVRDTLGNVAWPPPVDTKYIIHNNIRSRAVFFDNLLPLSSTRPTNVRRRNSFLRPAR